MKLFSIEPVLSQPVQRYFGTKGAAMKAAREHANAERDEVEVMEHTLIPGKAGIVALANGPGWAADSVSLKTIKPRGKR